MFADTGLYFSQEFLHRYSQLCWVMSNNECYSSQNILQMI